MGRKEQIIEAVGLYPLWVSKNRTNENSICTNINEIGSKSRAETELENDHNLIEQDILNCKSCVLHREREKVVVGEGVFGADWFIVGEAPGAEEDTRGKPFVGAAGKLLDAMLQAISVDRKKNAYISNIVKCRPPKNRNPSKEECLECRPYLDRQLDLVSPKIILAMGRIASNSILDIDKTIMNLRGKIHDYKSIPVIVTYHPAYLLRSPLEKAKAWVDLCFATEVLADKKNSEIMKRC